MKKRDTKQIFAETLLGLMQRNTLRKITVQQIVSESGFSLQTFYNHFQCKDDLVFWIHQHKVDSELQKMEKGECTFHQFIRKILQFYSENEKYMWNLFHHTRGQESYYASLSVKLYASLKKYILSRFHLSSLPEEIDFYLKIYCYAGTRMYIEWTSHMKHTPVETYIEYAEGAMPEKLKPYLING